MGKYFGTDGIRGKAGEGFFTPTNLMALGRAIGQKLGAGKSVVIGKDTRLSGAMIEAALSAGLLAEGIHILSAGILPTPGVAFLTKREKADMGIMLTASHNPHYDNGLKLFGADARKLSEVEQDDIEARFETAKIDTSNIENFGKTTPIDIAPYAYIDQLISSLPKPLDLSGRKLIIDMAHGAGAFVGPKLFHKLGAEVVVIGDTPNGTNINAECGSTAPQLLAEKVRAEKADMGLALDGDADRIICVDELGRIIDGDQLLAILVREGVKNGTMKTKTLVATIMSNLGLALWAKEQSLTLERTKVGDKQVAEAMYKSGANLGGENSGHIIMSDFATTGDGLLAALHILAAFQTYDGPMSAFSHVFDASPQALKNIKIGATNPLEKPDVAAKLDALKAAHEDTAYIVIRKSGTENLIRIMAQATDSTLVGDIVKQARDIIQASV